MRHQDADDDPAMTEEKTIDQNAHRRASVAGEGVGMAHVMRGVVDDLEMREADDADHEKAEQNGREGLHDLAVAPWRRGGRYATFEISCDAPVRVSTDGTAAGIRSRKRRQRSRSLHHSGNTPPGLATHNGRSPGLRVPVDGAPSRLPSGTMRLRFAAHSCGAAAASVLDRRALTPSTRPSRRSLLTPCGDR